MSDEKFWNAQEYQLGTLPAVIVLGLIATGGWHLVWNDICETGRHDNRRCDSVKDCPAGVQQDMSSLKDSSGKDEKASRIPGDLKVVTGKLKIPKGHLKKARGGSSQA